MIAMTVAIVVLLLQSVLSPFQAAFTELIGGRVDGFCARRLMQCTLTEASVAQLKQAAVLGKLSDARRGLVEYFVTPGAAAAGLVTLIARYWWRARAAQESDAYPRPLWCDRRRVHLGPFIWFSLTVLAGAAVLVLLRNAAGHGELSVLDLSLTIQAILIPLRFSVFFPEAGAQTQYGMLAHDSILQIERAAAAEAGWLWSGRRSAQDVPRSAIRFEQVRAAEFCTGRSLLACQSPCLPPSARARPAQRTSPPRHHDPRELWPNRTTTTWTPCY